MNVVIGFLAESHCFAGSDKFREVSIKRVLRKSSQLDGISFPVQPSGKCNSQYLGNFDRILAESFIKVSYSEKHQCIGMFSLYTIMQTIYEM